MSFFFCLVHIAQW
uniref:Uncharacterized protein n=1 Tax=Arundo donax TaxID=35708 RepID=A0A0A8YAY6_ARUDO